MHARYLFTATLAVAALVSAPATYAAAPAIASPVHAMFSKSKMVKFDIRNDASVPFELTAGDTTLRLAPGETVHVSLPAGTRLLAHNAVGTHQPGDLIAEVDPTLDGNRLAIH